MALLISYKSATYFGLFYGVCGCLITAHKLVNIVYPEAVELYKLEGEPQQPLAQDQLL